MFTNQDGDKLFNAIEQAFADEQATIAAAKEYNAAAKALREALARKASRPIILAVYYPTMMRRAKALRAVLAGQESERALVKQMQSFESAAFGEVFTLSMDRVAK